MSLLDEKIIPGDYGMTFGTNAKEDKDLARIKKKVMELKGITDVILNTEIFPREFTVHTDRLVEVKDVEEKVEETGFHAIPKSLFAL